MNEEHEEQKIFVELPTLIHRLRSPLSHIDAFLDVIKDCHSLEEIGV